MQACHPVGGPKAKAQKQGGPIQACRLLGGPGTKAQGLTGICGPSARTAAAVGGPPRSTRAMLRARAAARGESASLIISPPRRSMYSSGSSCTFPTPELSNDADSSRVVTWPPASYICGSSVLCACLLCPCCLTPTCFDRYSACSRHGAGLHSCTHRHKAAVSGVASTCASQAVRTVTWCSPQICRMR